MLTVIVFPLKFIVLPFVSVPLANCALLAIYESPLIVFVTFTVSVPINELYPAGGVISSIVIVSIPVSVISMLFIETTPLSSVVTC